MRCPECSGQLITIEVVFRGFVTAAFGTQDEAVLTQPTTLQSTWEDSSYCRCETCFWEGSVREASDVDSITDQ